jgi:cytoskeleton protein RodZ
VIFLGVILAAVAYGGWYWLSSRGAHVAQMVPPLPDRLSSLLTRPAALTGDTKGSLPPTASPDAGKAGDAAVHAGEDLGKPHEEMVPPSEGDEEVKPGEVKPAEVKAPEAKPAEVKAPEAKPAEVKPAKAPEVKSAEVKPADVKPADVKPAEVKAPEVKPAEVKPPVAALVPMKPAELKAVDVKPAEVKAPEVKTPEVKTPEVKAPEVKAPVVKAAEVKPAEAAPPEAKPIDAKPIDAKPVDAKPVDAKPAEPVDPTAGAAALPEGRVFGAEHADARVVLRATAEDCWVQVRELDGSLLLSRLLRRGESFRVPNRPGLSLMVGNAGALEVTVDGHKSPPLGAAGQVKREIVLDPDKLMAGD